MLLIYRSLWFPRAPPTGVSYKGSPGVYASWIGRAHPQQQRLKRTKFHQRICTAAGLEDNTINAADQNASASAGASKGKAKGNARSAAPKRARAARAKMTKSHQEGVGGCRGR
ncbi:hypothetical protein PG996_011321 [Apiospora saccharicola]|uniref:Uncharacterized protein n=1 Tax=Apiospora saccharicola TaxID=335842 RepID=A0ABR1UER4_9PEZI